jgi:hypothetical protein
VKQLDCDVTTEDLVACEEHLAHAAHREESQELVARRILCPIPGRQLCDRHAAGVTVADVVAQDHTSLFRDGALREIAELELVWTGSLLGHAALGIWHGDPARGKPRARLIHSPFGP